MQLLGNAGVLALPTILILKILKIDHPGQQGRQISQVVDTARIAGRCDWEVALCDHLPLSSTFFGRPKPPDLPLKTSAAVPLPRLFSLWRYDYETSSSTSAHAGRTWPAASSTSPDAAPSTKVSHSPSQAATLAGFAPELQHLKNAPLPVSGAPYLVYSGVDFDRFPPRTGAIPSGFRCPPALARL